MHSSLTAKQRAFVEAYAGNATEAALAAGYSQKTAYSIGQENLKKPEIQNAIQARESKRMGGIIANREARQIFWTNIMRDETTPIANRLRASELLGKSEGDFLERIDNSSSDGSMTPKQHIDLGDRSIDELMALTKAAFRGGE